MRVRSRLAVDRRRLAASLADARAAESELAAAREQRVSFVTSLRSQKALKESQIRNLLATAHAVELKSQQISAAAATTAPKSAADPPPSDTSAGSGGDTSSSASSPGGRTLRVSATGYALPGRTATGMPVGWGVVAVDPNVIPLGTRMTVPGYGEAVAADVGSAVRGATIDLWFPTLSQARAWGRRTVTITLH